MKRSIEPDDFVLYKTLSHPDFSPDGSKIAISVHYANKADNEYNSDIIVVNSDGTGITRYSYGARDSSPRFSPDSRSLLFLSKKTIQKDDKGNELYVMSPLGGEARRLLKRKEGIESATFSPDSKTIYFLSKVFKDDEKDAPKVVTRIRLWFNGEGFVYNVRKHLFSISVDTGDVRQITSGDFDVSAFHISHDGRRIGYLASTDDMRPYITDLFVIENVDQSPTKLTHSDLEISDFAWSPDDLTIAINGDDLSRGFASNSHIWLLASKQGSSITKIENIDLNKGNSLNSDARQGAHGASSVIWDRDYIYFLQGEGDSVHAYRVKQGGKPERIIDGERSIEDFDVKNGKIAFVSMDSSHLEELLIHDGAERKLTAFNDGVYSSLEIIAPEHFTFRASDGATIDSWVLAKNRDEKLPTILYVHGGPKTAFGNSYMHEFQVFASKGYAVLFANIRGSDGYPEDFADIRKHYGERDFKDLLETVEFATEKFSFLDRERMGIAGGSYGGFMTNWAIGHTHLFKAAVTDRSIASWSSMFGTSDIGPYFTKDQIGGDPYSGRDQLDSMSPIRYVSNVTTPVLIVHSMEDYRCWMVEGLRFFTALRYLGKTAEMVLFQEENHDLSRIGKPKHRVDRLQHYLRWFDKYLKSPS